jgi:hypothetical protein
MGTRCFMHIPKSAGTSVHVSLEEALPPGAIGPKRQDATLLCGFTALTELDPSTRALLAVDPDEVSALATSPIVSGHFSLPTLLQVTSPSSIATVLREPRARLLSHFAYWRLSTGLRSLWRGYAPLEHALRPLHEFLAEPEVAQATDNLLCRMLLTGDPRIPEADYMTDPEQIASDAIAALHTLGFVGIVELQEPMWRGLSAFFDAPLSPKFINTTAAESLGSTAPALDLDVTAQTLELISARTAADSMVYRHFLSESGLSSLAAEHVTDAAFASELLRLGNVAGSASSQSRVHARKVAELSEQLATETRHHAETLTQLQRVLHDTQVQLQYTQEELSRNHSRLEGMRTSLSWRITAPARAAKRKFNRQSHRLTRVDRARRSDG